MDIVAFHAHIYFTAETRNSAFALYEFLGAQNQFTIELGRFHEKPIGPHPIPMFTLVFNHLSFADVVSWLMLNHGTHSVLIHPETGDDLKDHTVHALWLGDKQNLDFSKL